MRGPEHLRRCMQCGESWIDHTRDEVPTCGAFAGSDVTSEGPDYAAARRRSETLYAEWEDVQARVRDAVEWVLGDHEETEPPPTKEQAEWARQMAGRIVDQAMMHLDGYTASDITALPSEGEP